MAFALDLQPTTGDAKDLRRKLLGLTLPLRLALTAQQAGAAAIVVSAPEIRDLLRDDRLTIPVLDARPSGVFLVRAPSNLLIHRGLLSAGISARGEREWDVLAEPVDFTPPFGFAPTLVTSKESRRAAERSLLLSLRKPQDGWTSTYLNRYVSLFFTRFLVATPLLPNQVSIGILAIGLAGAWLATKGTYWNLLLGAFLFQMQSILDGCDGEMSRLEFRGSKTGEWLDTVGDDLTNYGFFAAAGWGLTHATSNPIYLYASGVVVTCGVLTSAIEYRYLISIGSGDLLKYPLGIGAAPGATSEKSFADYVSPLFKRDTFVFLTLVAAGLGLTGIMLLVFAAGGVGILLAVIKAEIRMAGERRQKRASEARVSK